MRFCPFMAVAALAFPMLCVTPDRAQPAPVQNSSRTRFGPVEITSDTQGIDFGHYLTGVLHSLRSKWYPLIPADARWTALESGRVAIEFKILKDGNAVEVRLASSSGNESLDRASLGGVVTASPFPPLPSEFKGDFLALRMNFFYNPAPKPQTSAESPAGPVSEPSAHPPTIVVPPRPISVVRPKYPKEARKKKIEGPVVLRASVTLDGTLRDLTVVSGDPILADAALEAVRQWRYQPSKVNGEPVEAQHEITVTFKRDESTAYLGPDDLSPDVPLEPPADIQERILAGELVSGDSREVTHPTTIFAPDPEYSETARRIKYQGTCVLGLIVGADGNPLSVWITRPAGEGLDEKSIEAVKLWKFQPATKDGEPVAVFLNVETTFRLY
jgi:TonB family protein